MNGMDDNKINLNDLQPPSTPVYESVPVEELKPEEVAPEIDTRAEEMLFPRIPSRLLKSLLLSFIRVLAVNILSWWEGCYFFY